MFCCPCTHYKKGFFHTKSINLNSMDTISGRDDVFIALHFITRQQRRLEESG